MEARLPVPDLSVRIKQEEALKLLSRLDQPSVPDFYACGIIDTDIGYYQLTRTQEGERILVFALNLTDLQLKTYAGYGTSLFAHPEKLFGAGKKAYGDDVGGNEIYLDMLTHQQQVRDAMRKEYTLVRTGPNVYQSRAISYAVTPAPDSVSKHIDSYVDALHNDDYAAVYPEHTANAYLRMRHPRIRLSPPAGVDANNAVPQILENFTYRLNRLTTGHEAIQIENEPLTLWQRLSLRFKINAARLIDKARRGLEQSFDDVQEKKVTGFMELVKRGWALVRIPALVRDSVPELLISLWEAFHIPATGEPHPDTPVGLRPYVEGFGLHTRLNAHLHPLKFEVAETLAPLTAKESGLCPTKILDVDPFAPGSNVVAPTPASVRTSIGNILLTYPNTSLTLQANGVWVATRHDTNQICVGYNRTLDTTSNPVPPPVLTAWLNEKEKALRYVYDEASANYRAQSATIEELQETLAEIFVAGDGRFLEIDKPDHQPKPHVLPEREPPLLLIGGVWVRNPKAAHRHADAPMVTD